jgi:hypothetical protein
VLAARPSLSGDREAVLAGHPAAARAFLPRARRLLAGQQVPWPAAFAAATHRHLQQTLNLNVKCLAGPQTGSENTSSRQ